MQGNNFQHQVEVGLALAPQSVSAATVVGETITEPWIKGRQLAFMVTGGAFAASSVGAMKLEVFDGSSWADYLDPNSAVIKFADADVSKGGAAEGGAILGVLDLSSFPAETYEAVRLSFTVTGAPAILIGASYAIYDFVTVPSGQAASLWDQQRYG